MPFFQNNTTRPICKFLNSVGFFRKVALMYIFEKLSTHYKILLLVGTYFFVITSWCVLYSYIFSREILSRHRPIKLHHAYPFYLNFHFSLRNFFFLRFSLSGICLYTKESHKTVSSYLLNELVNFCYYLSAFLYAKRRKYHWTIVLWK